ncbi:ABC transporter ATP-binding protein [Orrella daihaiensis]|uniref:ABC transporter ATP-binding protein n=1 Tax=Orrella daihaiensis TaxID=2782176 RepID=A0ABY4ANR3_9BURK|nr:ABC transporter ATP-binding protein [Orrella daihaiensis]UOD49684.1 ABC transporter ATP-binding protein [Orrella daihaiensis]
MPRLRVQSLTKAYPSVLANDQVNLSVGAGEIHAVLGENGAGKSTLMKMIYGVTAPTSGTIYWEDQPVDITSPAQARALGIGMVFQHFSLFETLTVAENTALFLPPGQSLDALSIKIREVSEHYGLPIDPNRHVFDLSVGERQRVEIIRCLIQKPKLLIMDEPTSVLTPAAVDRLFETLRQIRAEGCAIVYISHKLDEILALCDRVTVLRDGRVTGECVTEDQTPASLARMMIGHDFEHPFKPEPTAGEVALSVNNLSLKAVDAHGVSLSELSFSLKVGEIVGIAGISGNGQRELCSLLAGEVMPDAGDIHWFGQSLVGEGSTRRRQRGLCYVPEDRLGTGALADMSLTENSILTAADRAGLVSAGFLKLEKARAFADRCIKSFQVKTVGARAAARSLSGGNLQKFIMARELEQSPTVLICAQPTWGVDVGAAAQIRQSLIDLARSGCAVLVISEELDELFDVSDRIGVMFNGKLSPIEPISRTNREQIGLWMSGLWQKAA